MSTNLTSEHAFELIELTPATEYSIKVISTDRSVTAGQPALFSISNLTISPANAKPQQPVTVRVTASNTGDVSGIHEVVLNISSDNKSELLKQTLSLAPGERREVSFSVIKQQSGAFEASVEGLRGSFFLEEAQITPTAAPSFQSQPITLAMTPATDDAAEPTVVRWYVLAVVIGAMSLVATFISVLLFRRRREIAERWRGN
jgi:hypothetical protein